MNLILLAAAVLPLWQDMQATSLNAETKRTEVIYYASREDALKKGFRESENYVDLNGIWDFKYFDDYHDLTLEPASWDRIKVPGNWRSRDMDTHTTPISGTTSALRILSRRCCRSLSPQASITGLLPFRKAGPAVRYS